GESGKTKHETRPHERYIGNSAIALKRSTPRFEGISLGRQALLGDVRVFPGEAEEHVDHRRIELRPRTLAQPPARLFNAEALPVRPVCGHRVERVANEDDPRLDRNLVAGLPVRITVAVPALVAAANDAADLREAVDRLEDPLAEPGVQLDDLSLLRRERPGLEQDAR